MGCQTLISKIITTNFDYFALLLKFVNQFSITVKKSFVHQRKEHTEAIKRLRNIDNYERLYKMIMILGTKMIDIIETSKRLIESTDFNPDDRSLPKNVTIQSGNFFLSLVF